MTTSTTPANAWAPAERSRRHRVRRGVGRIAIYLLLIIGSAVTLLPFIWLVRSSLMGPAQIFSFPIEWVPNPIRWENYPDALTAVPFDRYFLNTMRIEFLVIVGTLLTSTMSAFAFARLRWRGRNLVFGILLSGLMLPYAATLIPTFILWQKLGGLGTIAPLVVPAWFGGGIFNIFLLRQFFMTHPTGSGRGGLSRWGPHHSEFWSGLSCRSPSRR